MLVCSQRVAASVASRPANAVWTCSAAVDVPPRHAKPTLCMLLYVSSKAEIGFVPLFFYSFVSSVTSHCIFQTVKLNKLVM
ncbi:hypothetical protein P3S67_031977 [Capsicum chacoense]